MQMLGCGYLGGRCCGAGIGMLMGGQFWGADIGALMLGDRCWGANDGMQMLGCRCGARRLLGGRFWGAYGMPV